jgi:hypothetical protein
MLGKGTICSRGTNTMRKNSRCKHIHVDPHVKMSLALSQYHFSTPEIRLLMRHVLGHALSGRTIKRLIRSSGSRLKRGRPRTRPRVHKGDMSDLIEATSNGLDVFSDHTLQLFQHIQVQFGLTPRQYLKWVTQFVRRGKCMMRKCLLCGRFFPSLDSGERHCRACRGDRRRLLNEERRSSFG